MTPNRNPQQFALLALADLFERDAEELSQSSGPGHKAFAPRLWEAAAEARAEAEAPQKTKTPANPDRC